MPESSVIVSYWPEGHPRRNPEAALRDGRRDRERQQEQRIGGKNGGGEGNRERQKTSPPCPFSPSVLGAVLPIAAGK